jgi:sulfatase modifying factor 1
MYRSRIGGMTLWGGMAVLMILVAASRPAGAEAADSSPLGMTFVRLPAGQFKMGSPEHEPYRDASENQVTVTITRPFSIQTTEVTLGQWQAVMGRPFLSPLRRAKNPNLPVDRVSWHDVQAFIAKLNTMGHGRYRLPTEAEWEYAARAGSLTAYPWGESIDCSRAMYENSRKHSGCRDLVRSRGLPVFGPAPVGSYPPNAWGLHDMHGNLWEWCQDWLGDYPTTSVSDPTGPAKGSLRVRRGGSWYAFGKSCRSANRAGGHPASRLRTTGFRLVRVAP